MHIGISRLVDKGCYKSYFPLHEGDWRPDHLRKNALGTYGEIIAIDQGLLTFFSGIPFTF